MPPTSGTVKDQPSESFSASPFSGVLSSGRGKQQQDEGERTKGKAQPDPGLTSQGLSEQPRKQMRIATGTAAPRASPLLAAVADEADEAASSGDELWSKVKAALAGLPESVRLNAVSPTSSTARGGVELQDDLFAIAASAAPVAVTSVGMPDFASLLTRKADQQQQSAPGQKDLQTAIVRLPEMFRKGGLIWVQAEWHHCTSAPLALPRYSTVHDPEDATQQHAHWRHYMYPEALSRKAR